MRTPHYSVKRTDSLVLLVPPLYKIHWIMWTFACLSLPLLINSTTGHYNSTGMYSTGLWSAFLASVQQGRALPNPQTHNTYVSTPSPSPLISPPPSYPSSPTWLTACWYLSKSWVIPEPRPGEDGSRWANVQTEERDGQTRGEDGVLWRTCTATDRGHSEKVKVRGHLSQ